MDVNERRAVFVYDACRLHAIYLECPVIPKRWEERRADFVDQFIRLVSDLCEGRREFQDFEEAHDSWMEKYLEMGWKYGAEYDPDNKIHPDLVPYGQLDPREKIKDEVFLRIVNIARDCIW